MNQNKTIEIDIKLELKDIIKLNLYYLQVLRIRKKLRKQRVFRARKVSKPCPENQHEKIKTNHLKRASCIRPDKMRTISSNEQRRNCFYGAANTGTLLAL